LFHYLGHTNAGVLDQGWSGWLRASGPAEEDSATPTKGNFTARPLGALEVSVEELREIHQYYPVVDGRPANHYSGKEKFPANPSFGRIPGSLSQPWQTYLHTDENGLIYMRAPAVPPLLEQNDFPKDTPFLLTCFGGTGAAVNYVVFYHSGYRNMRLDDAGLRRWNSRNLPLEKD